MEVKLKEFRLFLLAVSLLGIVPLLMLAATLLPQVREALTPGRLYSLWAVCALYLAVLAAVLASRRRLDVFLRNRLGDIQAIGREKPVPLPTFRNSAVSALLVWGMVLMGLGVMGLAIYDADLYWLFIDEDELAEYASALFWLGAALCAVLAWMIIRRRPKITSGFYLPLIAFFIVCAGEEISWGNRLFEMRTPDLLQNINKQGEINFHNIGSISVYANVFFLLTLGFFLVLPWMLRRYPDLHYTLRHFNAPVLHPSVTRIYLMSLAVWVFVGLRFGTLSFSPLSLWGYYTQMDDEVFEMFAAYCFFAFSLLDLCNRLGERKTPIAAPRAPRASGPLAPEVSRLR